ncbi:Transcriptional regulatory protein BtsR [bioreactor metagenome]|uniref:Transcriptional regulatory protein BtsR n=1 Tax=bioreactor metagenome TaxID=1076179 RepID=A0A645HC38_9ZZZZ
MKNILIIEDDERQRINLKKIISENDVVIYEAQDKDEALDICNKVCIDIFLVDIVLKSSSGLDFALEIRKINKYELSWIIFITTHREYLTEAFKQVHCYDYIIKPYDKEEILSTIRKLISHG